MYFPLIANSNDENYSINTNEADDAKLPLIKHYLGMNFVPIPFLWHYNDFALPFPIYSCRKIPYDEIKKMIGDLNIPKIADFYVVAQYRKQKELYAPKTDPNELYLSYHTWLYYNFSNQTTIDNSYLIDLKFGFSTSIVPIEGNFREIKFMPTRNNSDKFGGISIKGVVGNRRARIHKIDGHVRFSSENACNFEQLSDNAVFLSVMSNPYLFEYGKKYGVETSQKVSSCVVLHIFRNVGDNNPQNEDYQKLIVKYFS